MKFTVEKSIIQAAIVTASRAAAAKSAVPALEGLLVEASGSTVKISGYDLKTGISTSFPADVIRDGSVVLSARLFGDIIRKLPDNIVTLTSDDSLMTKIDCSLSEFQILGTPAADYPDLPVVDYQRSITIGEKVLKSMISQSNFAVSDNESRPIHTGALFEAEKGLLTIVAVDGYRLALRREELTSFEGSALSFVVPGTALSEVEKILSDGENTVSIMLGSKHIMFSLCGTVLISRRLEGEFLNYKNSIPHSEKYTVDVERRRFVEAVERVALIINDKLKSPVRCTFEDGLIKVLSSTALGRASDECPVKGDGEGIEIGFNDKYLLEALKAAPSDLIRIKITSGISPCVITPADSSSSFLYMILPVRLKANEG